MRFFDDFKSHHANFIHVISYKGGKILWQIDSSCGVLDVLETSRGGKLLDPIPNSFPDTSHKTWVSPNMKGTAFYGHFNWVKHDQSEWNPLPQVSTSKPSQPKTQKSTPLVSYEANGRGVFTPTHYIPIISQVQSIDRNRDRDRDR
jgi:hypothetical protein